MGKVGVRNPERHPEDARSSYQHWVETKASFRPRDLPDRAKPGPVVEVDAPTNQKTWPPGVRFGQVLWERGHVKYVELPTPPPADAYRPSGIGDYFNGYEW